VLSTTTLSVDDSRLWSLPCGGHMMSSKYSRPVGTWTGGWPITHVLIATGLEKGRTSSLPG